MARARPEKGLGGPSPASIKKEKEKARSLRQTTWWQNLIQKGICHYCGDKFDAELLTMDHVVPLSRGGKSSKGNIVPSCKTCNSTKKHATPVDMILSGQLKPDLDL